MHCCTILLYFNQHDNIEKNKKILARKRIDKRESKQDNLPIITANFIIIILLLLLLFSEPYNCSAGFRGNREPILQQKFIARLLLLA